MTKYIISENEVVPIKVEFEDQFKIVYFQEDVCGKHTIYKQTDAINLFPIFETSKEAVDYQSRKVERKIMNMQIEMKEICEKHAEFLKKHQI